MVVSTESDEGREDTAPVTFFYVFASVDDDTKEYIQQRRDRSLDSIVIEAFRCLETDFPHNAKVLTNPKDYNLLRAIFFIERLPAFGISDVQVSCDHPAASSAAPVPPIWRFWRRKERTARIAAGEVLPKVERSLLQYLREGERLRHFVRDLHLANIDKGLTGVYDRIESEMLARGGKKLLKVLAQGKKEVLG